MHKLAITSMSLGRATASHTLEAKLNAAHKYGYAGIELFHEDLLIHGLQNFPHLPPAAQQLAAARHILHLCQARNIAIVCLQPFAHYEGLLDRTAHAAHLEKLKLWIQLAHELETDMIQIPASFLPAPQVSDDLDLIVSDLQIVADMGAAADPPIRFAYEALCWSTVVDVWEDAWEVVKRVDRPNFGTCLDTFNIAGRIYADPAVAGCTADGADEAVRASMARLVASVDVSKVFYVQVVDAERLREPLVEGHAFYDAEQPARMSWSRNCRLFYGETGRGAYLPVKEISRAFFHGLGFEGWVSLELFNRRMNDAGNDVPDELARRGAVSWEKLARDMRFVDAVPSGRISASL
ncbi:hypothetical protein OQA88_1367 [Cercophora sp. LCS_1]